MRFIDCLRKDVPETTNPFVIAARLIYLLLKELYDCFCKTRKTPRVDFAAYVFPVIKAVYPNLHVSDIIAAQPMMARRSSLVHFTYRRGRRFSQIRRAASKPVRVVFLDVLVRLKKPAEYIVLDFNLTGDRFPVHL